MILKRKAKFNIDNFELQEQTNNFPAEKLVEQFKDYVHMQHLYNAAMMEVSTKLEILDDEFRISFDHNPIHHMECRLKNPRSIYKKLEKLGLEPNIQTAMERLTDIAGIRVTCYYTNDAYKIAELLLRQNDIKLVKKRDYIKNPKPNGYRSLHIVVSVPVFLSKEVRYTPVEVQIRTIAMDFWASLEHELKYKSESAEDIKDELSKELTECATNIAMIDAKMQEIYNKIKGK